MKGELISENWFYTNQVAIESNPSVFGELIGAPAPAKLTADDLKRLLSQRAQIQTQLNAVDRIIAEFTDKVIGDTAIQPIVTTGQYYKEPTSEEIAAARAAWGV